MRARVLLTTSLGLVLSSSAAHAMGVYIDLQLVVWNDDGSSAIVKRITTSSGQVGAST